MRPPLRVHAGLAGDKVYVTGTPGTPVTGTPAWDAVNRWRLDLHKEFDAAFQTTRLPDRPDHEAANTFPVMARRSMVAKER